MLSHLAYVTKDAKATEESVKALDGQGYPAVLHLASHGFCYSTVDSMTPDVTPGVVYMKAADPLMRSGIVLAGGNYGWNKMSGAEGELV